MPVRLAPASQAASLMESVMKQQSKPRETERVSYKHERKLAEQKRQAERATARRLKRGV